ncbi:MAG: PASTA domain-containing protein [Thermodesulfovibrionales bacterium]|nr:PASTA domain-containing protein [Thermodesulfovibrionales bacterium]
MKWYIGIPVKLAAFLAVCAVTTFISYQFLSKGITVKIPDIRGKSLQESEMIVQEKGLLLKVNAERYDHTVPNGFVLDQDLPPGSHVRGQAAINVVLSKGPEVRLIPSSLGMALEEAKASFMEKNLIVGKVIHVHSDSVLKGVVVAQKPAPEEWSGEHITLLVSDGPYDIIYYSPFFLGMNKRDALLIAADLGLNVEIRGKGGSQVVTHQSPEPGTEINKGGTIRFTIGGKV